jgi:DNA polymerase elongation subunit (family B)
VHKYPTISSLALAIYRKHYLENNELIPLITGKIYNDISKAYHGGHTDVYGLYSNEEIHSYDYSSMYPTQMFKHEMPTGKIDFFEGNPLKTGETLESLASRHAFINCSVYVDETLNRPVYQTILKINGEARSACATGVFLNQWVYVPELLYYEELTKGKIYIIIDSIQKGYLFDSKNIFKDYINDLYNIKKSVNKNNPMYLISKILMNSLYGRMGLKQSLNIFEFMENQEIEKFSLSENVTIKEIIEFEEYSKSLVVTIKNSEEVCLKSSVAIAAAITARSRMVLAPLLLDNELDILYIDTDSYKCKQKITDLAKYKYLDHEGLGALKYEGTFSESLFLLPKVYGGIYKNSGEEFTKIKGFKDKFEFSRLKELLFKQQELKLTQNKWYRNILKSYIKITKSPYLLSLNENKRIIDLKTFKTKPYHFKNYKPED